MITFILREGEKKAFSTVARSQKTLFVKNEGGKLQIAESHGAIGSIAGKGMSLLVRRPRMYELRETCLETVVPDDANLRIVTPESLRTKTCVYIDVGGEKFWITGDASIISEIIGDDLQDRIE